MPLVNTATSSPVDVHTSSVILASGSSARRWARMKPWFLNTTKYPASLLFLLMTLGPTIALLPVADRGNGRMGSFLAVFGRVPMFYYLLHIPAIHLAGVLVSLLREGRVNPWLFGNHPMMPPPLPEGYTWSLPLLYLVFALVIAALYIPCRWYAQAKAARRSGWMRYV